MSQITRYTNEKEVIEDWKEDKALAFNLVPGTIKNKLSLIGTNLGLINSPLTYMCSTEIKKDLESHYGKSGGSVDGKYNKAKFFAFMYKEKVIACISESRDVGTSWYWLPLKEGSRYGNPMLVSYDKEVKDFWPDFCEQLTKQLNNKTENKKVIKSKP